MRSRKGYKAKRENQTVKLKAFFLIPGLLIFGVIFYASLSTIIPSRAYNPIPESVNTTLQEVYPQGWNFYTRATEESDVTAFRRDQNEGLKELPFFPSARFENFLGLSRIGRSHGIELGAITEKTSPADWMKCSVGDTLEECFDSISKDGPEARRIENVQPSPHLCGPMILVEYRRTEWAYRELIESPMEPLSMAFLKVECQGT